MAEPIQDLPAPRSDYRLVGVDQVMKIRVDPARFKDKTLPGPWLVTGPDGKELRCRDVIFLHVPFCRSDGVSAWVETDGGLWVVPLAEVTAAAKADHSAA